MMLRFKFLAAFVLATMILAACGSAPSANPTSAPAAAATEAPAAAALSRMEPHQAASCYLHDRFPQISPDHVYELLPV